MFISPTGVTFKVTYSPSATSIIFLTSFVVIAWTALPAVLVLAAAVRCIVILWRYYRSSYYRSTPKPYLRVLFNKGRYGEYLTYHMLRQYEKDGR